MSVNVQINVTESVSPPNVATIDRPDLNLTGNSYSKVQVEDKLTAVAGSSYLGELPKSYNFPTTGSYTFNPTETGVYTINGHALPAITQQDFDDYFELIIRVTDGVPSLTKKEMPMSVASFFDPSNSTKAQGAKQINSWLVNDVKGGESDEVKKVNEEVGAFYKKIGIDLNGSSNDGLQSGAYNVKTNSTAISDANKFLTKANIRLHTAGNFKFCVGRYDGSKFIVKWESSELSGVTGWNNYDFTSQKVKINNGEMAAVLCLTTSTAKIYFGDPGATGNRFVQYSTVAGGTQANLGSFYALWFELSDIDEIVLPSNAVFNLSKSVSKIVENYSQQGYTGVESEKGESIVSTDTDNTEGYAINKVELDTSYKLEKIEIKTVTAGVYQIVTGFIEQAGKFIEKNVITRTLNAGLNTIILDPIILNKGDYVGLKFPSKFPVNNAPTNANLWATNSYTGALTEVSGKSLPIKLFLKDYIESPISTKADLQPINTSIAGIQQMFTINGKKVKLLFNTDGSVMWEYVSGFSNIGHLTNSIGKHPVVSYWWGSWGMAASEKSKDYVHIFHDLMKTLKPNVISDVMNIAGWESNPTGWDKSQLDSFIAGRDLIYIRLGENATYNSSYKAQYLSLINYIKTKNPTAFLLIGGVFWADANKDAAMSQVAAENNLIFVPLSHLDIPSNRSSMGAQVKGDDGQWHTVNNSGVAAHPGDLGHLAIGNTSFNALGL